ncbi:Inositol-pentakisphosphate 2-kinase [Larimichthys crocea]|uniref:Inositol-pentakisphosphate 2-kinase n=1 Tax=Larimichthys crocea TaxID=215358 RepID=A0A0F8C029_LARCR|nr:inositol-pentakisphosphate 2-kinase [Larimichthys crocea]KAE8298804.1 Inositol-pentakisphosphate 2-kinase [Larimichthys crocea]
MDVDKMEEKDWKYHGEGNKSLVLSHVQLSRVLRLLKYPAEDSENPPQTVEQAFRQIQNIVDFSSNVMSSLLGEKFIHSGEVVKLPLEFVRQLSIRVQHQRPAWRCDKVMDIYSGCALCLPNLTSPVLHQPTHTPPLCIEIKPKCGFLPSSKHVSKDIKTKVCRFCMHQHYKVASGKWRRRSLYCPLDLFSGNRQRMHFAIRHLIEEPQNNFKIFKGGQCIYSSKEGSDDSLDLNSLLHHLRPYFLYGNNRINTTSKAVLNDFIQVLVNALLSGGGGGDGGMVTERQGEGRSFCEASLFNKERIRHGSQGLPSDSVLFRILQTQMLDTQDIEGLYPLYHRVEQHLQDFPKESVRTRLQIDGPYDEAFLEKLQKCPTEDDGSVEFAVAKVHQYRVAMTAKDCSIMVALVPSSEKEEDDEGQRQLRDFLSSRPPAFSYSVSILDLDPKPFDSIPRQLRLDQKIVSCYLRTGGALPKGSLPSLPGIFTAAEREDCTLLFHPV